MTANQIERDTNTCPIFITEKISSFATITLAEPDNPSLSAAIIKRRMIECGGKRNSITTSVQTGGCVRWREWVSAIGAPEEGVRGRVLLNQWRASEWYRRIVATPSLAHQTLTTFRATLSLSTSRTSCNRRFVRHGRRACTFLPLHACGLLLSPLYYMTMCKSQVLKYYTTIQKVYVSISIIYGILAWSG